MLTIKTRKNIYQPKSNDEWTAFLPPEILNADLIHKQYTFIWIIESLSQNINDKETARPFLESDKLVKIYVLLNTASETVGVVSKVMLKTNSHKDLHEEKWII